MKIFLKLVIYIFFIILILIFPTTISEVNLQFSWIMDKHNFTIQYQFKDFFSMENQTNSYTIDHKLVYFNNSGHILFSTTYPSDLNITSSISKFRYARYFKYGHSIGIYEKNKRLKFFPTDSYPVMSKDGQSICLVTGEGEGFQVLSLSNFSVSKPVRMGYPLIDVARGQHKFYLGLLNGIFIKINPGVTQQPYVIINNQDSSINIIKRIAISDDERYMAYLSGLFPEFIKIFDNKKNKNIYKIRTGENKRKKTFLVFSFDDKFISEETKTGFNVYDIHKQKPITRFTNSNLKKKKFSSFAFISDNLFLFSFSLSQSSYIYLIDRDGKLVASRQFLDKWLNVQRVSEYEFLLEGPHKIYSIILDYGGYYE